MRSAPVNGVWFDWNKVTHGTKHEGSGMLYIAHEDWISSECPQCGRVWQGREGYIHALIAGSPGGQVALGDSPRSTLRTSRDW